MVGRLNCFVGGDIKNIDLRQGKQGSSASCPDENDLILVQHCNGLDDDEHSSIENDCGDLYNIGGYERDGGEEGGVYERDGGGDIGGYESDGGEKRKLSQIEREIDDVSSDLVRSND
eukprot:Seg3779.3 transcript_id=Seg3779.3/GoldUCD/mRNA.D3Y31 product="hypothetical protein" protein_id=Seg3779.3/GoldUCD/D3Y31